jgi:pyruvate formate lyase activating enzyme
MNNPPTPQERLEYAYRKGKEKLDYVYVGNITIPETNHTSCPHCGNLLIERSPFFSSRIVGLDGTQCKNCGKPANIIR